MAGKCFIYGLLAVYKIHETVVSYTLEGILKALYVLNFAFEPNHRHNISVLRHQYTHLNPLSLHLFPVWTISVVFSREQLTATPWMPSR